MDRLRILFVDDDTEHARGLAAACEPRWGRGAIAPDVYQALTLHSDAPFDVVVLEVALPGASGIDLLERLVPAVPAVVLTWLASPAVVARALEAGARTVLTKPCPADDLADAIQAAARSRAPAVLVKV